MKLIHLEPQFIAHAARDDVWTEQRDGKYVEVRGKREFIEHVSEMQDAQGIMFLCPKCFHDNGGSRRTHHLICWARDRGVSNNVFPRPGRWAMQGTGYADLTLSPSVQINGGCGWHGFVQDGDVA